VVLENTKSTILESFNYIKLTLLYW